MLETFTVYCLMFIGILGLLGFVNMVIFPRGFWRGIHIGRLDHDNWTGQQYLDWYKAFMRIAEKDGDTKLMRRATVGYVSAWYDFRMWRER